MNENKNLLETAITIATNAHINQLDKCGEPYIFHPFRVMITVNTLKERIVAVLHDVLEDTDITIEVLKNYFTNDIIEALIAITKNNGETYQEFIKRCCLNSLAMSVKRADISDNNSSIRLYKLDLETRKFLRNKYAKAINYIDGVVAKMD